MPLSFHTRRVGDVIVVTCTGQITLGEAMTALEAQLDAIVPVHRQVLLHLGDVHFIDSSALGLLVRYMTRAQNAAGTFRICAVSPSIDHALRVTRLKSVLQPYESETRALEEAHRNRDAGPAILCLDESEDVLAYLREVLREAGYSPVTAANLPDARILLETISPSIVVVGESLRPAIAAGAAGADDFQRLTATATVIDLPHTFPRLEAAGAAEQVLAAIRGTAGGASGRK